MSDVAKTPREELECKKRYLYEHSMFWECNNGSKCQILEEDVCDLLNELLEEKEYFGRKKEYFLSKWSIVNAENIQLRQEIKELKKENKELKEELNNLKKDETILYHYYTLARYSGDGV